MANINHTMATLNNASTNQIPNTITSTLIYDSNQVVAFAKAISLQGHHIMFSRDRKKYGGTDKIEKFYSAEISPENFLEHVENIDFSLRNYPIKDSFAIYTSTNSCNVKKARKLFLSELLTSTLNDDDQDVSRQWISCLRRSRGEMKNFSVDLDDKTDESFNTIIEMFDSKPVIVETKNGYHFIANYIPIDFVDKKSPISQKELIKNLHVGNIDCSIPGTLQGGFKVMLI